MGTITSANAIYQLGQASLYPSGVQLQQFSTDDMFGIEAIKNAEIQMGIDGIMSAGFIFVAIPQKVTLLGNSPSAAVFDLIYTTEISQIEKLVLSATIAIPSIGLQWTCTNGFMTSYKPMPDAKKVLGPREFEITWNSVIPSPIAFA